MSKPTAGHKTEIRLEKWFFLASIVLFCLSLFCLVSAAFVAADKSNVPYDGVHIGKVLSVGTSKLTVVKVEHKPGSQPFVAPKGYEYLIVTLKVENKGEKPFSVLPTNDTYVKTADGNVSYLSPYALKDPFHSGVILPGEATQGELSYLVPKMGSYKFYVESDWSSTAIPFMVKSNDTKKDE